MKLKRYFIR